MDNFLVGLGIGVFMGSLPPSVYHYTQLIMPGVGIIIIALGLFSNYNSKGLFNNYDTKKQRRGIR